MRKKETAQNCEASLATFNQLIQAQRTHILNLEHQRDLFAEGYRTALEKCDEMGDSKLGQGALSEQRS